MILLLLCANALSAPPATAALDALPPAQDGQAFSVEHVTPFAGGDRVRVSERWAGLPVYGGGVVVVLDPAGGVRRVVGQGLEAGPRSVVPAVEASSAVALADAALDGEGQLWDPRVELGVLADGARLVWRVEISRHQPLGAWAVYVDADDGDLIRYEPTLFTARGNVYATNPENGGVVEVELPDADGTLAGSLAAVLSCDDWSDQAGCQAKSPHATPDEGGDFLFEPDAASLEDPFAEVQMYYHLDLVADWFRDLGFSHNAISGQRPIEGIVNFAYGNAFYGDADGDGYPEVAFGQGNGADFSYDADVIYHEFTHSVYGEVVRPVFASSDEYGYDSSPGALNEGTADLFALALTGDPSLGEYAGAGFGLGSAVRELGPDRRCPYDIYGESHEDGMIWASLGWNLIDDPLLGGDLVARLAMGAISAFPSDANFADAGDALLDAADDLLDAGAIDAAQHAAIVGHAEASGLPGCPRAIPLDFGDTPTQFMRGRAGRVTPLYTQFSLDAPQTATKVTFRIDDIVSSGGALGANIYVRRGEPVLHELQQGGGGFARPVPVTYDYAVEAVFEGYELVLDRDSDHLLQGGDTYYFAVASTVPEGSNGFRFGEITLSGDVEAVALWAYGDTEGERAGCGCATGSPALAWPWLAALLIGVRRRA